jgi:general stress protein 26
MAEDTRERLHSLVEKSGRAMPVSHARNGEMHARSMAVARLSPGSDAVLVTGLTSLKVGETALDPDALVTFQIDQHAQAKL